MDVLDRLSADEDADFKVDPIDNLTLQIPEF